eukprot:TRINITY_DN2805_c0_g2_i2.p1 TRINITY_DN2805_c0_g2~~TRINITY_DN2805_c0_g2_i2.p1  ORF type:complete len:484 (+),score=188.19 TRINITY_DN2805_c0_g2_i2:89-1540(+)
MGLLEAKAKLLEDELKLETLERGRAELSEEIDEMSEDVKLMAKQLENLQCLNQELSLEVERLQAEVNAVSAQKLSLEKALNDSSSKKSQDVEVGSGMSIKAILLSTELERQILFKHAEKATNESELKRLQVELARCGGELEAMKMEVQAAAAEKNQLKSELAAAKDEKEKVLAQAACERTKIEEEFERNSRRSVTATMAELQKVKADLAAKEEELRQSRAEVERHLVALNTLKQEQKESWNAQFGRTSQVEAEFQSRLRLLTMEKDALHSAVQEAEDERERLREELDILYSRYDALERNYTILEEKLEEEVTSRYNSKEKEQEREKTDDILKITLLGMEVERLHSIKNEYREELDDLEATLEQLQTERERKSLTIREEEDHLMNLVLVSAEVERLHDLKAELITDNKEIYAKHSKLEEENKRMALEIVEKASQMPLVACEFERLHLIKEELVDALEAEKGRLASRNEYLEEENSKLQELMRQL